MGGSDTGQTRRFAHTDKEAAAGKLQAIFAVSYIIAALAHFDYDATVLVRQLLNVGEGSLGEAFDGAAWIQLGHLHRTQRQTLYKTNIGDIGRQDWSRYLRGAEGVGKSAPWCQ